MRKQILITINDTLDICVGSMEGITTFLCMDSGKTGVVDWMAQTYWYDDFPTVIMRINKFASKV